MKLLILAILFPAFVSAQYDYLKLENKQVTFERKYQLDSFSATQIQSILAGEVPTIKGGTDFYNGGEVTTIKFEDAYVDYKRYGGKWGNTAPVLNWPFTANASIVWKDGAYRVTITNVVFHTPQSADVSLEDLFTRKKVTEFRQDETWIKNGKYVEQYFSDLFKFPVKKDEW